MVLENRQMGERNLPFLCLKTFRIVVCWCGMWGIFMWNKSKWNAQFNMKLLGNLCRCNSICILIFLFSLCKFYSVIFIKLKKMYKCTGSISSMGWIPEIKIHSPKYRNQYRQIFNAFMFSYWESLCFSPWAQLWSHFVAAEIGKLEQFAENT